MKKILSNKYFLVGSRILIGLIFIISGITKISNPHEFIEAVNNFQMLPPLTVNLFVIVIPWIEFSAGLLFLFNIYPKETGTILLTLLIMFTIAVVVALLRSFTFTCGCFGNVFSQEIGVLKLIENLFLVWLLFNFLFNNPKNSEENR